MFALGLLEMRLGGKQECVEEEIISRKERIGDSVEEGN